MLLRLKVFRFCLIEISVCGCVAITYLKIVNASEIELVDIVEWRNETEQ